MIRNRVVGFSEEPFTLASGRQSHFYVNWRAVCDELGTFHELLGLLAPRSLAEFPLARCFYGVPEGGTKLGLILQYELFARKAAQSSDAYPFAMGRAKPKERGPLSHRNFLGTPAGHTVLVEDVATSGQSLLRALKELKQLEGCIPYGVMVLTDRQQRLDGDKSLKELIEEQGLKYFAFSHARGLLERLELPALLSEKIRQEFEK
ncbi:MAG: hypothetical protein NDJ90_13590 [Oligoflexia bacterium]|nr:hypothetical protein [Oligoflexia bacterium]